MKLIILAASLFLLAACNPFESLKLQQSDVDQYIRAYEEIAKVSPTLETQRKEAQAISIMTCPACRKTLRSAVQAAGYKGISDFLLADARISITAQYALQAALTAELGEIAQEFLPQSTEEVNCKDLPAPSSPDAHDLRKYCEVAAVFGFYLNKLGDTTINAAKKIMQVGDFKLILDNIDEIVAAVTNPELIDEFYHGSGGWDD